MSQVKIRSALAEDRDVVLLFCAKTWDWGDYIDYVWDDWLNDPAGQLFVATIDEQPVGIVYLQMLTQTDAWLQGLRVDPAYRQQGIGRALSETAMVEAMQRGATAIRLAVEALNTVSIQLYTSMQMRKVGAFLLYTAPPMITSSKPSASERTQLATLDDLDHIIDYLNASNVFPLTGGLYYREFKGYPITAELLEKYVTQQQIYLLRRWERLDGLAIVEQQRIQQERSLSVGYIDGITIDSISLIAYDLRRRVAEMELDSIRAYAPDLVLVHDAFNGVEYIPDRAPYYSFERGLV